MTTALFTIVSSNYLHYARTMFESVAIHHPDAERICVLVDTDRTAASAFSDEFSIVGFDELRLPDPRRFAFRYSILELNTAVKPWAFELLFSRGFSEVVYIDPDIRLYRPLTEVFYLLAHRADFVLTPHLLAPMTDDRTPSELDIRRAGTYNLGFCALADRGNVPAFLHWWKGKLVERCVVDHAAGMFVDQSWIDLVPGLFRGVAILRHAGYNVAYWNLAQRPIRRDGPAWFADGQPLVFFHFSGFDPERPEAFSKYQDRFCLETLGAARQLVLDYAAVVLSKGGRLLDATPYGFGTFDDGTPIPDFFRRTYRGDPVLQQLMGDDPFSRSSILTALLPATRVAHLNVTYAMQSLWLEMPDVRAAFPLTSDESVIRFYDWFQHDGHRYFAPEIVAEHATIHGSMMEMMDKASPSTGDASPECAPTRLTLAAPRGWFTLDTDAAEFGVWTAPDAALPCRVHGDAELIVDGMYFGDMIERQTGSNRCRLSIELQGRVVHAVTLDDSGPFTLRVRIDGASFSPALSELRFRCSSFFVPRAIGYNDDRRQLAWRARRIALDGMTLLDSTATPSVPPLSSLGAVDGVNLIGYLYAESGVGESVRSFARCCDTVGIRISLHDVGHQTVNRQEDDSLARLAVDDRIHRINVLHVNADQTGAALTHLPAALRDAARTIAYWHWEQPALPMTFLPAFEGLTEVWVPSGFVRDAVAAIAPIPVFKVPHAVEFAVDHRVDRGRFGLPGDRFLFLVMYDFDSVQSRKNPEAAIAAYRAAFGLRGDVGLVVKTINGDRNPEERRRLTEALDGVATFVCIDDYLDRDSVYALENACDGLISLHRSEGFGLALAEMMFLGKPVVATGWSGNMEFMTPMNSFPVEYALRPLERRTGVYEAAQLWAEADVEHASHLLRRIVDDAPLRERVGASAAAHMRRHFSRSRVGAQYNQRLSLLT